MTPPYGTYDSSDGMAHPDGATGMGMGMHPGMMQQDRDGHIGSTSTMSSMSTMGGQGGPGMGMGMGMVQHGGDGYIGSTGTMSTMSTMGGQGMGMGMGMGMGTPGAVATPTGTVSFAGHMGHPAGVADPLTHASQMQQLQRDRQLALQINQHAAAAPAQHQAAPG